MRAAQSWASMVAIVATASCGVAAQSSGVTAALPQTGGDMDISVFSDEPGYTADVSPDGHLAVVFTQPFGGGTGNNPARIEIRNLLTHERTILAGGASSVGTPGRPAAAFSPDSKLVAYTWLDPRLTDTGMLQVIGVAEGAKPRTVIPADPSDIGIIPHGWSPDGRRILVLIHGPSASMLTDPTSLAWVSVADGSIRKFKTLEAWRDGGSALPKLSPDGRWIAYSAIAREGSTDRHIFVIDSDGQSERTVATLPGSSSFPLWSPDSSHVVFVNRQGRSADLFAVDAQDRAATPIRLEANFAGNPIAISKTGTLYSMQYGGGLTGVIVERGPAGGNVVEQFAGYGATWFKHNELAFIRNDRELVVRTLDSGSERAYPHTFIPVFPPRVLSGGSGAIVYIPSYGDNGRPGGAFYRFDFATGASRRLFSKDEGKRVRSSVSAISPDNRTLYVGVLAAAQEHWSSIVGIDVDSGHESTLLTLPESLAAVAGLALSPDGQTLALHQRDGRIVTARASGGSFREVSGRSPGGGWREVVHWSPDGRSIVFATRDGEDSTSWRLMRVAADGGIPEPFGVESSILPKPGRLTSFDLSPDGARAALSVRATATFDVRALRNVVSRLRK